MWELSSIPGKHLEKQPPTPPTIGDVSVVSARARVAWNILKRLEKKSQIVAANSKSRGGAAGRVNNQSQTEAFVCRCLSAAIV